MKNINKHGKACSVSPLTSKAGIGIAEVLVASVVGSVLLIGSAQSLKFSLQSAQVARAILSENDLKASIAQGLNEPAECANSLKNNLKGPHKNDWIGELTNGLPAVKVGDFNGDIEVVKIESKGDHTDNSNKDRNLVVYYKKKGLGDQLNTLGTGGCSPKNGETPAVITDCYYHSCLIDTKDMDTSCKLKTCHNISQAVLAEMDQRVVDGVSETIAGKECLEDHYLKGFDSDGKPDCAQAIKIKECEDGKVVQGIREDGSLICVNDRRCAGGKIWTTIAGGGRGCRCPSGQHWNNTNCVTCSSSQKWVQADLKCMGCSGGGATWHLSDGQYQCQCPAGTHKEKKKTV